MSSAEVLHLHAAHRPGGAFTHHGVPNPRMDVEALLNVQPDLLARLILHRRERLAESIPPQLADARARLEQAVAQASSSKRARDASASKVDGLRRERDGFLAQAADMLAIDIDVHDANVASSIEGAMARASEADEAKAASAITALKAAQKAEAARQEHAKEHELAADAFQADDKALRGADSRVRKLTNALDQCHEAIAYWQGTIADGFDGSHPLQDEARAILAASSNDAEESA